jgi:hypothetical protein
MRSTRFSRLVPESGFGQPPPGFILDLHIMVVFSPVISDEQQTDFLSFAR